MSARISAAKTPPIQRSSTGGPLRPPWEARLASTAAVEAAVSVWVIVKLRLSPQRARPLKAFQEAAREAVIGS